MADYADRARALVGTPFRPQGRGAAGLDCVGLIVAVFGIEASSVRRDYRLRGDHRREIERELGGRFRPVRMQDIRPGDILLLGIRTDQVHLAVKTEGGFVHAHARIGRVVETPGTPPWPLLKAFRRRRATVRR